MTRHGNAGGDGHVLAGTAYIGGVDGEGDREQFHAGSHFSVDADFDAEVAGVGGEDRGRQAGHRAQFGVEDAVVDNYGRLGFAPERGPRRSDRWVVVDTEDYRVGPAQRVAAGVHQAALVVDVGRDCRGYSRQEQQHREDFGYPGFEHFHSASGNIWNEI
ncbi:MAG TPA: hypothetical protein DEQ38_13470 [Elusimicrobia bacterium]|nr:hypothetical protein [Elusimicrobiota bacterium]